MRRFHRPVGRQLLSDLRAYKVKHPEAYAPLWRHDDARRGAPERAVLLLGRSHMCPVALFYLRRLPDQGDWAFLEKLKIELSPWSALYLRAIANTCGAVDKHVSGYTRKAILAVSALFVC